MGLVQVERGADRLICGDVTLLLLSEGLWLLLREGRWLLLWKGSWLLHLVVEAPLELGLGLEERRGILCIVGDVSLVVSLVGYEVKV